MTKGRLGPLGCRVLSNVSVLTIMAVMSQRAQITKAVID